MSQRQRGPRMRAVTRMALGRPASSLGRKMTPASNTSPDTLMSNKDDSHSSAVPNEKSALASATFQDDDDRVSSEERSHTPKDPVEDAGRSEYPESANEHPECATSEERPSDTEFEPIRPASNNRSKIKYGPNHNGGLPVAGASSQNTIDHCDGQNVEEEILLGRDAPQHVRCLPWRTKNRIAKRSLITWDGEMYTQLLLALLWVMETYDYPIPWPELAALVNPGATGEAFKQATVKLRNRRVAEGLKVPPPRPSKDHPRHECKLELAEMMRTAGMNADPSVPEYGSRADNPFVAELRASTSQLGAQCSNGNRPRTTSQMSQCDSRSETAPVLEVSQSSAVVHSRSFTSAQQPSQPAITETPKPSLTFVAHIGPERCIPNSNRLEQKLIFDVIHNLVRGRFAKPAVSNPLLFIDTIPAEYSTEGLGPFPGELGPEFTMAPLKKKHLTKKSQQKRKRSVTSSAFDVHHAKRFKQHDGNDGFDAAPSCLSPEQHEHVSDFHHSEPSKQLEGDVDAAQSSIFPEPREPVLGTRSSNTKKRKVDDTDLAEKDGPDGADEMFNLTYAVPEDVSFRPPPFLPMSAMGMSSRPNLNIGLSYSPTRQPHGYMDGFFDSNMMQANFQSMGSMQNLHMDPDPGTGLNMGMGASSVGFNNEGHLGYNQNTDYRFDYKGPFMGACSNLDLTLDNVTSEQERALLSSTSEWRSSSGVFEVSSTERRLAGLPPVPGDSDYVNPDQLAQAFEGERLRHKDRGMLSDSTLKEPAFDPNAYANEEFSRLDSQDDQDL